MNESELIVRAIIVEGEKILLCKSLRRGHYYLPGGHIEFGEKAEGALRREFLEETGLEIEIKGFAGAFENIFNEEGGRHEVCLVFAVSVSDKNITSKEGHIAYEYVTKEEFANLNFLPNFIKGEIMHFWDTGQVFWASSIE